MTILKETKTKNKIKTAFCHLIETETIEKIKIVDITRMAGISRETFYLYYKNVEEIYTEIENNVINSVITSLKGIASLNVDSIYLVYEGITNDEFATMILGNSKYSLKFMVALRKALCIAFIRDFPLEIHKNLKLMIEFEVQGSLYLLLDWLHEKEPKMTLKNLAIICDGLVNQGFYKTYEICKD